jgi:hypothetical protein
MAENEATVSWEMQQISADFHLISCLSSSRPNRHFTGPMTTANRALT